MVNEGRGRLFKRKDGKYLIYLPKDFAEDSMFPFQVKHAQFIHVSFQKGATKKVLDVREWTEQDQKALYPGRPMPNAEKED